MDQDLADLVDDEQVRNVPRIAQPCTLQGFIAMDDRCIEPGCFHSANLCLQSSLAIIDRDDQDEELFTMFRFEVGELGQGCSAWATPGCGE
ncbi:MAG: hypothetical protein ACJARS_000587 [bacterium]